LSKIRLYLFLSILLVFFTLITGCSSPPRKLDQSFQPKAENKQVYLVNNAVEDILADADSSSERVTQALLGDPVQIIDESSVEWYKVKVPDGYVGYVRKGAIVKESQSSSYLRNGKVAMIKAGNVLILVSSESKTGVGRAFRGSQLPLIKQENDWLEIALPGGRNSWIKADDAMLLPKRDRAQKGSPDNVIATARLYLGVPYLWGGVTSQGIDCSGLTYITYLLNGVKLPRDANMQYKTGTNVDSIADLKKGDLVFFATDAPKPDITHVGIYIGAGRFIHAANKKEGTIISKLEEPKYLSAFRGGRRFL